MIEKRYLNPQNIKDAIERHGQLNEPDFSTMAWQGNLCDSKRYITNGSILFDMEHTYTPSNVLKGVKRRLKDKVQTHRPKIKEEVVLELYGNVQKNAAKTPLVVHPIGVDLNDNPASTSPHRRLFFMWEKDCKNTHGFYTVQAQYVWWLMALYGNGKDEFSFHPTGQRQAIGVKLGDKFVGLAMPITLDEDKMRELFDPRRQQ